MSSIPIRYTELQAQRSIAVEELYRTALRLAAVLLTGEIGEGRARRELERAARDFASCDRLIEHRTAPGDAEKAGPAIACNHQGHLLFTDPEHKALRCGRCGERVIPGPGGGL